jgi:hypothetical protein
MLKDSNYLTILPFMIRDLGLSGPALLIYAVIYSFSQDGESVYSGSIKYLSEWTGADERTVSRSLTALYEKEFVIRETRPGFTNKYRVNPDAIPKRISGNPPAKCQDTPDKMSWVPPTKCQDTPDKMSGVPPAKCQDTPDKMSGVPPAKCQDPPDKMSGVPPTKCQDPPDKMSGDIDLHRDLKKENEMNSAFSGDETAKTKEDAQRVFLMARALWNELHLAPECRDLIIPPMHYDALVTFQNYTPDEIKNAIRNFDWHRSGRCGPGWKPPPAYKSLYGFLKTGVAQYHNDAALDALFKEERKYGTG